MIEVTTRQSAYTVSLGGNGVACDQTGSLVFEDGHWRRKTSADVCTSTIDVTNIDQTGQPAGGVTVAPSTCLVSPHTGVDQQGIAMPATDGASVQYKWVCSDPGLPGLTQAERVIVAQWILDSSHLYPFANTTGSKSAVIKWSSVLPGGVVGDPDINAACVGRDPNGERFQLLTISVDGTDHDIVLAVSGDPRNPTLTFTMRPHLGIIETLQTATGGVVAWPGVGCAALPKGATSDPYLTAAQAACGIIAPPKTASGIPTWVWLAAGAGLVIFLVAR